MLSDTSSHRKQRAGPLMLLAEAAISARRLVTHALANALPVDPNSTRKTQLGTKAKAL
jgi:hypothetical protein